MKHLPIILFILGLLIEVGAFFVGSVDQIPWLLPAVAPDYHRAKQGLARLNSDKILGPNDKGFDEISKLFIEVASKQSPPELIAKISITKFVRKGAMLGFSTQRAREIIPVEVHLSNGKAVKWDLNEIKPLVEELKSLNLFKYAVAVFLFGVLIQIIGFILERTTR